MAIVETVPRQSGVIPVVVEKNGRAIPALQDLVPMFHRPVVYHPPQALSCSHIQALQLKLSVALSLAWIPGHAGHHPG